MGWARDPDQLRVAAFCCHAISMAREREIDRWIEFHSVELGDLSGRAGKKISLVSLLIHKIVSASFECIYRLNNPIYVSLKCFYRFSFLFHFIQPNNKLQFQFLTFLISFRLVSFAFGFASHTVCSKKQLPAICMLPVDQVKPKPVASLPCCCCHCL